MVPSGSRKGCGACLLIVVALCSIMISSFLLVPARVPGLVSLLFLSFLSQEEDCVPSCSIVIFWLLLVPGSGSGACLPSFSFVSFLRNGMPNEFFIAHERRGNMVCCCLGSMLV